MAAETRERILDVAERLFADSGFVATSLRDITAEARVNLAAVNYHFGTKEALLGAILDRRFKPINDRRIALLDELEAAAGARGAAIEQIVTAFVGPPFQSAIAMGDHRRQLLKLLGQIHSQANQDIRKLFLCQFNEVRIRFTASFQRALPDIDPDEVAVRVMYVVGAMTSIMSWDEQPGQPPSQSPDRLLQSLVDFATAGMAAPVTLPRGVPLAAHGGHA